MHVYVCVRARVCVWKRVCVLEKGVRFTGAGGTSGLNSLVWMLRIKLVSSERVASAPNCQAISPALKESFKNGKTTKTMLKMLSFSFRNEFFLFWGIFYLFTLNKRAMKSYLSSSFSHMRLWTTLFFTTQG